MPLAFSRYNIVGALQRLFQLKGQPEFRLDQTIVPVSIAGDTTQGPYQKELATQVAARTGASAVAAELPYVWVTPGPQVILEVSRIHIVNPNAATQELRLAYLTAASVGFIGVVNSFPFRNLNTEDLVNAAARSSVVRDGNYATDISFGDLDVLSIPAGGSEVIKFPHGCFLYGSDPTSLALVSLNVNTLLYASFYGREWPIAQ